MSTESERRQLEHLYLSGCGLFHKCRYHEALIVLRQAEDASRASDARGPDDAAWLFLPRLITA